MTKAPLTDNGEPQPTDLKQVPASTEPDESVSVAAIYARTSVSKPDYHYSIDEQVSRCWQRCEQQGWKVGFVFQDEAESGTNTDRPDFKRMLQKAEEGFFDIVVFWKLDRFCRSLADLVKTEEKLNEWGVALQSVTEYLDTASPVGRFNFRNLASAAELESDLTSQRVRLGLRGMAKQHKWPNASPPYGYDLAEDRTLTINECEAEVIRWIFNSYIEVRSMPRVAILLNDKGISTKGGEEWSRWTVRKVLSNELYRGLYRVADYEEMIEEYRIVSDDLFKSVTETRFRFSHQKDGMDESRKKSKGERILKRFKQEKEVK